MKISDIIQKDSDRVFVTDFGCFIIFTGNTLDDSQPFIRIGNWMDMPVELIPLVENIIITDDMPGNPAQEQFNIDINTQSSNRYIGSHYTLKRFLDFQKIFGLDLKNVTIVDVEKDIPEISSRSLSDRESFIGIFYRDGNFKISHNKKDLFDLQKLLEKTYNTNRVHDDLYENTKSNRAHFGSGFTIADSLPLFFDQGSYFLYMLPQNYQQVFDQYGINPRKISAIAHPSANYLNLTAFLRWINHSSSKLTILSDDKPQMNIIKKLFSRANLTCRSFSMSKTEVTPGMIVNEINGSGNLEVTFNSETSQTVNFLYFNNSTDIDKIIKQTADFFVIPYSVFECCNLVLKSTKTPYFILEDSNPNFSKLSSLTHSALFKDVNYQVIKYESSNDCLDFFNSIISNDIVNALMNPDNPDNNKMINDFFENESSPFDRTNCISLIKYLIHISTNRKISSYLKKLIQNYAVQNSVHNLKAMDIAFSSKIIVADEGVFTVYTPISRSNRPKNYIPMVPVQIPTDESSYKNSIEYRDYAAKIENDRKRLHALVQLYLGNGKTKPVRSLKKAINERKEIYKQNILSREDINKLHINQIFDDNNQTDVSKTKGIKPLFTKIIRRIKTAVFNNQRYNKYVQNKNEYAAHKELKGHHSSLIQRIIHPFWYSSPIIFFRSLNRILTAFLIIVLVIVLFSLYWKAYQKKPFIDTIAELISRGSKTTASENITSSQNDESFDTLANNNNTDDPGKNGTLITDSDHNTEATNLEDNTEIKPVTPPTEISDLEERLEGNDNEEIIEKFKIKITDAEILYYLNEIAVINGYRPLGPDEVKGKNPHWIFPNSIFTLPDGERFIVRDGDSMWKIAELKLTKMSIEFHKAVESIKSFTGTKRPDELFEKANKHSFGDAQKNILKLLEDRFK